MENIILDYRIKVVIDDSVVYHSNGGEVFMDEHNVQWIKFIAENGYDKGSEHMVRTDRVVVVRVR